MFAVVRTGGKQYRVAEGDIIAVEKLAGEAGESVSLGDVLLAGEGEKLQDTKKLTVSAEIVEQKRGEKVTIFKKKRRKNYRRKNGHRQYLTLLKITGIGGAQKKTAKTAPKKAVAKTDDGEAETKRAAPKKSAAKKAPADKKAASGEKTVAKKAAPRKPTAKASPAKGDAEKTAPAKKAAAKKAPAKKTAASKSDDKDA